MKRNYLLFIIILALTIMPLINNAQVLYTQTGSDSTWNYIVNNNMIPIGETSYAGITGSTIDVNQNHPEISSSQYAHRAIQENIAIHTLGNSTVNRPDFYKWSRWYQEDENTQVFRLFKDEINVRNSVSYKTRIEAELGNHVNGTTVNNGAEYAEWSGTYTVIQPPTQSVNIFQIWGSNNYALMIELRPGGKIVLNRRYGAGTITMIEDATGKSFDIMVRDYGTRWEVYLNGKFFDEKDLTKSDTPNRDMQSHFRWGMYHSDPDDGPIASDCMLFVTGAQFRYGNNEPSIKPGDPIVSINDTLLTSALCAGQDYSIDVSAVDTNGTITKVELFLDDVSQAALTESPYQFNLTAPTEKGDYDIKVIANDNDGATAFITKKIRVVRCTPFTIPGDKIEAEDYFEMSGASLENTEDEGGGENIKGVSSNGWLQYEIEVESAGSYVGEFRVASFNNDIKFDVMVDNEKIASCSTPATGNTQKWKTFSENIMLDAGIHTFRMVSKSYGWNLNWFNLRPGLKPQVSIVTPSRDTAFYQNYNLAVIIDAQDADGTIDSAMLFIDDELVRVDREEPFQWGMVYEADPTELNSKAPGKHTIKVVAIDNDGFTSETYRYFMVRYGMGIRTLNGNSTLISIYPNPAKNQLHIEMQSKNAMEEILIYDNLGKCVLKKNSNDTVDIINIDQLETGIYFLSVIVNNYSYSTTFIKE